MSKHISMDDEGPHSHSVHSHHAHHRGDEDDLHPYQVSTSHEKEEKAFEQLMMGGLNYLPAFIQPEHHIVDGSHMTSPDHSNMLHPILAQNEPYFFPSNSKQGTTYTQMRYCLTPSQRVDPLWRKAIPVIWRRQSMLAIRK